MKNEWPELRVIASLILTILPCMRRRVKTKKVETLPPSSEVSGSPTNGVFFKNIFTKRTFFSLVESSGMLFENRLKRGCFLPRVPPRVPHFLRSTSPPFLSPTGFQTRMRKPIFKENIARENAIRLCISRYSFSRINLPGESEPQPNPL